MPLKAPFPWYGGKSFASDRINARLGTVTAYTEPFAGSLAVLLSRRPATMEVVCDKDGLLCNAWRAIQDAPQEVMRHADWPVSELDIQARHAVIVGERDGLTEKLRSDPYAYDARLAGWWLHGIGAWIGEGYGSFLYRTKPRLGDYGTGIHAPSFRGLDELSARLRRVRVVCGDWTRVVGPACFGNCKGARVGILLDPPYAGDEGVYAESAPVALDAYRWAVGHPEYRIAYCCYDGQMVCPEGWTEERWTSKTGRSEERVFFSPSCVGQGSLL
jgi:DNA adenine methylase